MKRFIASILSAVLMFNSLMPAYAAAEQDGKESATIKHFTLTADVIPGKLEELERYDVSMIDHGDVLENEEGVSSPKSRGHIIETRSSHNPHFQERVLRLRRSCWTNISRYRKKRRNPARHPNQPLHLSQL